MEAAEETELFTITKFAIEPELSALPDPVTITLDFTVSRPWPSLTWVITYVFDCTGKRHAI
jgi:hypothetical protein